MSPDVEEISHRVDTLERGHSEIKTSLTSFEKSIMQVSVSLEKHYQDDKEMVQTMRNIDDKLNLIKVGMSDNKLTSFKAIQDELTPLYKLCRQVTTDLEKYKVDEAKAHSLLAEKVEKRLQYQVTVIVVVCWALAGILYNNMNEAVKSNTDRIHISHTINK